MKLSEDLDKIISDVVNESLEILGNKHADYFTFLGNSATFYSELGDYQKALNIGKKVIEGEKEILGKIHENYLISLNNLALYNSELGNYILAFEKLQLVTEILKEVLGEKHPKYLTSLGNLASALSNMGDYQKALEINLEVVEIEKEVLGEKHPDYLKSLSNLALNYYSLQEFEESIEIYQRIIETRKNILGEKHPDYLTSLGNLASALSKNGDYQKALEIIIEVVKSEQEIFGEKHPNYLTSLGNLASSLSDIGDYQKALEVTLKVVDVEKEVLGEKHPSYHTSLANLAFVNLDLGKYDSALIYFDQSLNLIKERVFDNFGQLTEYQRENFWAQNNFSFEIFPLFLEKTTNPETEKINYAYDIALLTKGLLLNTTIDFDKLIRENATPETISKYEDFKLLKLQIQRLYEQPISERYLNVDSLESVAQKLETELVTLSKEYGDYTQNLKITWKDVQSKLGDNDVAIEFLEYPTLTDTVKYAALVLRKGWDNPKFIPLFRKDQIDELIKLEKNQIYSNGYVGKEIRKLAWSPLEEFISSGDKVYFSAAGIIHQLAIENLPFDETSTLGDRCEMHRLSSTKELVIKKTESKSNSVALYGGIKYDLALDAMLAESKKYERRDDFLALRGVSQDTTVRKGWQFLDGTLEEAIEVSKILNQNNYQVSEFIGEVGSEESFKNLSGKKLGIIHVATHGFFLPIEESKRNKFVQMRLGDENENRGFIDPMLRSGLMLAGGNRAWMRDSIPNTIEDGILTAKEISHLDLTGTELVVLSACETGLGDVSSEGVFGLQRAFKQAGAQTIIMSLWNVKDEATKYLMTNFYSYLMQGLSKREAFIQARNTCKEEYTDPESWAAFIMLD
jgi:tetratricopeptide (TPR) repeat protein